MKIRRDHDTSEATFVLPAEFRFLEVVRVAVGATLAGGGCDDGCRRDLQLASDEVAATLIGAARDHSRLRIGIAEDGSDVYVRMEVALSEHGFHPPTLALTRLLLDASVDSYEIGCDGDRLLGVIQRAMDSSAPDRGSHRLGDRWR